MPPMFCGGWGTGGRINAGGPDFHGKGASASLDVRAYPTDFLSRKLDDLPIRATQSGQLPDTAASPHYLPQIPNKAKVIDG
jgi:hypothetical protein